MGPLLSPAREVHLLGRLQYFLLLSFGKFLEKPVSIPPHRNLFQFLPPPRLTTTRHSINVKRDSRYPSEFVEFLFSLSNRLNAKIFE